MVKRVATSSTPTVVTATARQVARRPRERMGVLPNKALAAWISGKDQEPTKWPPEDPKSSMGFFVFGLKDFCWLEKWAMFVFQWFEPCQDQITGYKTKQRW